MKKNGILNPGLMREIASLGHTDMLCIADAGLPIPDGPQRIDLALVRGVPSFTDTLRAILSETVVESAMLAEEIRCGNPGVHRETERLLKDIRVTYVSHAAFKARLVHSRAIVRTGECSPYANILLSSGVSF